VTHLPDEALGDADELLWLRLLQAAEDRQETSQRVINKKFENLWVYLARRAPDGMLQRVAQGAKAISNAELRARVLCCLASRLTGDARTGMVEDGLESIRPRVDDVNVQQFLIELCDSAPPDFSPQFLAAAQKISDEYQRTKTLIGLAAKHPHDLHLTSTAFQSAVALSKIGWRAAAISEIAPLLPNELLTRAFDLAKAMQPDSLKALVYSALGARSSKHPRMAPVSRIVHIARGPGAETYRGPILINVARIDGAHKVDAIREALIVCGHNNSGQRTRDYDRIIAAWKRIRYAAGTSNGQRILSDGIRSIHDTRLNLLESFVPLAPALAHFGGMETIRSLFKSTADVFRWWP